MNRAHENGSGSTTTERAEQINNTIGYRLGFLAGTATQRLERAVSTIRAPSQSQATRANQGAQSGPSSLLPSEETMQRALVRAEELVQYTEQRLGQWSARLGHQSQRLAGLLREDLEDLWAEAQHIRHNKRRS
jgi:hypothetical protein